MSRGKLMKIVYAPDHCPWTAEKARYYRQVAKGCSEDPLCHFESIPISAPLSASGHSNNGRLRERKRIGQKNFRLRHETSVEHQVFGFGSSSSKVGAWWGNSPGCRSQILSNTFTIVSSELSKIWVALRAKTNESEEVLVFRHVMTVSWSTFSSSKNVRA